MKKFLPFLSIAFLFAACSPGTKEDPTASAAEQQLEAYKDSIKRAADTAGLAQFQQWKSQNELANMEPVQEEPAAQYIAPAPRPRAAVARSVAKAPVRKPSRATAPVASRPAPRAESPAPSVGSGTDVATSGGAAEEAKADKKEGMSKAAKGAVIGGAGGAVAGAVINKKNRAVGAVVGGILGAGGGYVIGRQMDKKDGRIEYAQQ
jgi:hypothetical protein